MRQLQLFTSAQLAVMRDRTKRRNYSAEADEFRREHERHRAWGLTQRHSQKLRRSSSGTGTPGSRDGLASGLPQVRSEPGLPVDNRVRPAETSLRPGEPIAEPKPAGNLHPSTPAREMPGAAEAGTLPRAGEGDAISGKQGEPGVYGETRAACKADLASYLYKPRGFYFPPSAKRDRTASGPEGSMCPRPQQRFQMST